MAPKFLFLLFLILFVAFFLTLCKLFALKRVSLFLATVTVSKKTQASSENPYVEISPENRLTNDSSVVENYLDDQLVTYITHPLVGIRISIPYVILPDDGDTLEWCTVQFPNGTTYNVYPECNVPDVVSTGYNSLFPSCAVTFTGVSTNMSGTYELAELTRHYSGQGTLQRQRFLLNVVDME